MAMNGTNLAGEIVDALVAAGRYPGLNATQINAIKSDNAIVYNTMVAYFIANMEISGITTSTTSILDSPTLPIPVPTDGGAAILTTMIANTLTKSLSQDNDGTGRVT